MNEKDNQEEQEPEPVVRLSRDIREAAQLLTREQARYLVDFYYQMQDDRIRSNNQKRMAVEGDEPNLVLDWFAEQTRLLEGDIRKALDEYSSSHVPGVWAKSIVGIGPVLSAGLLAHIDIERAETAGQIWSFAGLNPTAKWNRGERRPWNARLKVLCWKIGESFVKVQNNPRDVYGKLYAERKLLEQARNERGDFRDQAAAALEEKNFREDTFARRAYEAGKLPDARLHLRAERYAVKLFLSHLHEVMYFDRYGEMPPKPYILTQPDHIHFVGVPNAEVVPGLREAEAASR